MPQRTLTGIPAAPGVAIAPPWRYEPDVDRADEPQPKLTLDEAAERASADLERLAARLGEAGAEAEAAILEAQALMATDPELLDAARARVSAGEPPADAVLAAGEETATTIAALADTVLAARAADVRDVAARIARIARGAAAPRLERRSVAVAVDLPPSITAELDRDLLAGIVLEGGSPTAHAAILARALGIPAVVGVAGILRAAESAAELAIDGDSGAVRVDPDPGARAHIDAAIELSESLAEDDASLRTTPLATADGHRLILAANIGRPDEVRPAVEAGAEAIGLFRTEFAFMGRTTAPDVATQRRAYVAAMEAAGGRPLVVRLLDVGGDKELPYVERGREANPFLGMRAIRLAARHRDLLVNQLEAILEAAVAAEATAWIMAPMVADLDDVALVHGLLAEAAHGRPEPTAGIRLGAMVEVPSAVLLADQLAAELDFLSIGTNDLTQYLLAADRTNPHLALRQDPLHPAVVRAVRDVVAAARPAGTLVAVCGEMGGDPAGSVVLAGLGVEELSMDARAFGRVKRALGRVTKDQATRLAAEACGMASAAQARALVTEALAGMAAPATAIHPTALGA
jgi:phosphoenolpyruvate-protein phosphotransferase